MTTSVIRTVVIYFIVIAALRIMGKRQVAELAPAELVVTIMISNIATLSIEDTNIPLLGSILPIFVLVSCEVSQSSLSLKSLFFRRLFSGNPRVVIRDGVIDQQEMKNLRWSIDDLTEQLRQNGIFDVREVSFAMVETSGALSAYQKFEARPVTAGLMNIPPDSPSNLPPMTIITDGQLNIEALTILGLSKEWLDKTLKDNGITINNVFMMTCDTKAGYNLVQKQKSGG